MAGAATLAIVVPATTGAAAAPVAASPAVTSAYSINYSTCMAYYPASYCCHVAWNAPYSPCFYYWGDYYS